MALAIILTMRLKMVKVAELMIMIILFGAPGLKVS